MQFWVVRDGAAVRALTKVVLERWNGGRVLFLPNGRVVKPLQEEQKIGHRVLVGRFEGRVVLERPDGSLFDLAEPGRLEPGDVWPGPKTTGLECIMQSDGALDCTWYHPAAWGSEEILERLRGPDRSLAQGFRRARPGDGGGRVRVTVNGHVITNRRRRDGSWGAFYVGWVDPGSWPGWNEWISEEDL
ncbi:MAG: hypothetical protein ACF8XB_06755 [Planctomycetota bacterium JB042]